MGKQGRLREKQRRQGQRRLDARWEWRKPVLSWEPPREWLAADADCVGDLGQVPDEAPTREKQP